MDWDSEKSRAVMNPEQAKGLGNRNNTNRIDRIEI